MKIYVKGGAWKNIEDEILKTAVMKYGKHNWAIIASLLPRKSAKQCKARWYEWLEPHIKKVEWSRDEDEKLLHLAKIFPTQWRTISSAMEGRTAAQCLERYEQLLEEAQDRDKGEIYDPNSILNPRRLRPGEIDPNPENKPAKPDTIDMDEDELEMLSEAKARLANTMGKKEKRKAREAAMDEERRLQAVQRAREMKAAGIRATGNSKYSAKLTGSNKKRHFASLDVNKEIPFYHRPQQGLYNTSEESAQKGEMQFGKRIEEIEGQRSIDKEREQRKEDQRKQALRKKLNLPAHFAKLNRMHEETQVMDKRDKLSLPTPQVSDKELEQIGRMGYQIEKNVTDGAGGSVTRGLLADYKATPGTVDHGGTPGMTPHTGYGTSVSGERALTKSERLKLQARNLINISQAPTPLLGGQNTPLNETFDDFQGITPQASRSTVRSTPLVASLGMGTPSFHGVQMTPSRGGSTTSAQLGATPAFHRDQFKINETPLNDEEEQLYYQSLLTQLRESLHQLPEPKPTSKKLRTRIQVKDKDTKSDKSQKSVRDASEIEAERQLELERQHQEELKKRTQAVKRNLPRPTELPSEVVQELLSDSFSALVLDDDQMRDEESYIFKAQASIVSEIQKLIQHDAVEYPAGEDGTNSQRRKRKRARVLEEMQPVSVEYLQKANDLLQQEYAQTESVVSPEEFSAVWNEYFGQIVAQQGTSEIAELSAQYEQKNSKLSQKCTLLQGGYVSRESSLLSAIAQLSSQIAQESINLDSYQHIARIESSAGPVRVQTLQKKIQEQLSTTRPQQEEHATLTQELNMLRETTEIPFTTIEVGR